ncbi:MAG: SpoIIE family protein phosphatase, partial [Actinomycetota bacterium]
IVLATDELAKLEDEAALMAELSASWESLQAVYDLSADFNSFQDPKSLLKKITERAASVGQKIQTVLWLENGENLDPVAAKCSFELKSRDKSGGLIGKTFAKKSSLICNDVLPAAIIGETEPELQNACRLAIVPLTTRLATYGVLVVWQEFENVIFDSRTMRLLDTLALQAAMVVENDRLLRESIQNERLKQEVEIGSKIQQTLLTGTPPDGLPGITIAAETISSLQIDGDFYDFIEHGEDCFDLIIGDVMGKGIPAALVGAATKNCFLRAIGQLQSCEQNLRPTTEKIVTWVNNEFTAKLMQFESFVTACYARFDLAKGNLTFVDCGHTKTIHYQHRTGKIAALEGDNMPLGFSEREIFTEKTIQIETGDVLFFYSDGVTETRSPDGELFGDERLAEFIRQNALPEPSKIISCLLDALKEYSKETTFNDDLTCVAVRIGSKPEEKKEFEMSLLINSDLSELARTRRFVREAASNLPKYPITGESVEQLELAVTEAVTNIIEHAYRNISGNKIEISAERFADGIQIALHHWGEEFDSLTIPPPSFDGSRDGGFGLFIISKCVDTVIYSRDKQNRNTILLIKNSKNQ